MSKTESEQGINEVEIDMKREVIRILRGAGHEIGRQIGKVAGTFRPKSKEESLRDNKHLIFPLGTIRALRVILPEAFALTGENEETYKAEKQNEAKMTIKDACLKIIGANQGVEVNPELIAEHLLHLNLSYQEAGRFGRIEGFEGGLISVIGTSLLDHWPDEKEIKAFLDGKTS